MNYLTNYYKNLSEQLQAKVNQLQAQLTEGNDAPEYIKPNIKRGENNLTPRPISDEDYKKSDVKGEISRRFKNDKSGPMNKLKPALPYSERAGEDSERTGESKEKDSSEEKYFSSKDENRVPYINSKKISE